MGKKGFFSVSKGLRKKRDFVYSSKVYLCLVHTEAAQLFQLNLDIEFAGKKIHLLNQSSVILFLYNYITIRDTEISVSIRTGSDALTKPMRQFCRILA